MFIFPELTVKTKTYVAGYFQKEILHAIYYSPIIFSTKNLQNKTSLHFKMKGYGFITFLNAQKSDAWLIKIRIQPGDVILYTTQSTARSSFHWNIGILHDFWISWAEDGLIKFGSSSWIGGNVIVELEDNRPDYTTISYLGLQPYHTHAIWLHLGNGGWDL